MWFFGNRCFLGGEQIPKGVVPKYYKAADGVWKKCCPKHFRSAGLYNPKRNRIDRRTYQ